MMACWLPACALAQHSCDLRIVSVQAARSPDGTRPTRGWQNVTLPDNWGTRWPGYTGTAWYRIDWEGGCGKESVALGIDGIADTGEVFANDDMLWHDASLVEPLSRSWNVPRWWLLPASGLHEGVNTIWVLVVGEIALSPGLGRLRLGDAASVAAARDIAQLRQRTVYAINAVLAGMAGLLFLLLWALRPKEHAYGWFALMSLCWLAYLSTYLAASPWPWTDSISRARFSVVALVGYVLCACMFTFSFGAQRLPWAERALWLLAVVGTGVVLLAPPAALNGWLDNVWRGSMIVFLVNCLQFQWHAWRPRPSVRQTTHRLLALCWLVLSVSGLIALGLAPDVWGVARDWAAINGLVTITLVMLLLSGQLMQQMRMVERFNHELEHGITSARVELTQALAREHTQMLEHAKLQERMHIAHDLHDGLGSSLVRSMALVEQSPGPLTNDRVLSLFKVLRDDLRQLIDHGSSAGAIVPDTPVQWAAPLRHRFTYILDEMDVTSAWHIAPQWQGHPSALQCLGLTRLAEEALSNVIKHSQTCRVEVRVQTQPGRLTMCISDEGRGFDVEAVQRAGLSVGMRSMAARAERMGATFKVNSGADGTVVTVALEYHSPQM